MQESGRRAGAPLQVVDDLADRFRTVPFSYPEIGATRQERLPRGYRHLEAETEVGRGRSRYLEVAERLLTWQLHTGSGLSVRASDERARQGAIQLATLPLGPFKITTRCRVVYLIEEDQRAGFAYGTLEGHPERGEERFCVELTDDDRVVFSLRAFSRNAWLVSRLGAPVSNRVQAMVNRRYLAAALS
ncbi:hypothetical protein GCM10011575_33380 [Microlunatus endophyticus]|uniref:DUF1990 domain-containing protein n=1 Tax=Microlunatus endophyticus TaxID=1716077 RepID=A0A917SDI6_9ACTN|nr:DUF1990 domain-containing protein [Microlunatus endophyticus]GGL72393.1 hypothetical protein GCM10011575_33380 [Microlunatus endophyticus]